MKLSPSTKIVLCASWFALLLFLFWLLVPWDVFLPLILCFGGIGAFMFSIWVIIVLIDSVSDWQKERRYR